MPFGHGHAHGHAHDHGAADGRGADRLLVAAVLVNVGLTLAQLVGGAISGSLALVADALHNLSDAASLGVALAARKIARRPADRWRTYGYRRAEVIGALVNLTVLIVIGVYLVFEAVTRFFAPEPVEGWTVVIVAGVALAIDATTAAIVYAQAKEGMNVRAVFLHNVADALGSVAVIVAGTLIILYGWRLADPIATLLIAAYVLYQGISSIRGAVHILMMGAPADVDVEELAAEAARVPGVLGVHHVHVWQLDERHRAAEAHIIVDPTGPEPADEIKRRIRAMLRERYGIDHSTLELEAPGEAERDAGHHTGVIVPH